MKTIETKLFEFKELSESAKNKAIENERNEEEIFLYFFKEDAYEQIKEKGFLGNIRLNYSLSNCQGDGLSFGFDYYDNLNDLFIEVLGSNKQKTIDTIINSCSFEAQKKSSANRYCYSSKSDVRFEFDDYSGNNYLIHKVVSEVEEKIQGVYLELCANLEKQGYEEIEYQQSDEAIVENFEENERYFTEDGNEYKY